MEHILPRDYNKCMRKGSIIGFIAAVGGFCQKKGAFFKLSYFLLGHLIKENVRDPFCKDSPMGGWYFFKSTFLDSNAS